MFTKVRRDKTSYFLNGEFDYYRGVQLGAAEEFKVFYDSNELYGGETLQLRATKEGVTYASSADAVATVDAAGLVTAVAAGDVNITATLGTDEVVVVLKVLSLVEWDKTIGLVNPALAGEKGDPVVVGEKTYHVGYNAFKDLELMMAAAQANQTITVLPGAYDKAVEIKTNGLTLVGPLADKDPTVAANQADFADPAKAAQIQEQMYVLADNITIKGFSFNGPSRVQFFKKQSNFVFEYNYVDNPTYTKPTILFKEEFQGTNEAITDNVGGGFIHGGGNATSDYMINFRIERNVFKNIADTVVYLCMPENLEFNHNILDTYDIVGLRLDFGSTYGT